MREFKDKQRVDVNTRSSNKPGLLGWMETFIRRFRNLSFVLLLTPLIMVCALCIGLSAAPGMLVFDLIQSAGRDWPYPLGYIATGCGLAFGYLTYGVTLVFMAPLFNFLMPFRLKEFRGPWFSLASIPWFIHNALTYTVRFTFLEFITPSPLNILFFRMMGMKIGRGVMINTANISDPCLITLDDFVTIGGSATLFAHYGQKGYLIISRVRIGAGTTVGLKASVMGGSTIGKNVNIRPHGVVLPKTTVEDGATV
jgi:hypothetical protein